jgi:hypothetical protein
VRAAIVARRDVLVCVLGLAVMNTVLWVRRLAVFRKDHDARGQWFGDPPTPQREIYNPANCVPAARLTFRIVIVSSIFLLITMLVFGIAVTGPGTSPGSAPAAGNMPGEQRART